MNAGRVDGLGWRAQLLASCSKEEGQSPSPIASSFLAISLYFTILFFDKLEKEPSTMAVSFSFISGAARIFWALKHLIDKNKGTSLPSRWWPCLSFLVTPVRWRWFDMEARVTCSIFAMLSGSFTRTLGSCFDEGIGRFHFPSVALICLVAPQTQQNSETSKYQLPSITTITSSLKPSGILYPPPPSLKWSHPYGISFFDLKLWSFWKWLYVPTSLKFSGG